jgi:hypothetical protein
MKTCVILQGASLPIPGHLEIVLVLAVVYDLQHNQTIYPE